MQAAHRNTIAPSRPQDAFWQEVFDAATVVQSQTDPKAAPARALAVEAAAIGSPEADPGGPPAHALSPGAPDVSQPREHHWAVVPMPLPSPAQAQSDAGLAALARTMPEPVARGRAAAPSGTPPAPGQASSQAASPWPQAESCASEMPWRATFVVDAAGQRRLFLRASGLDKAQALALAARLDQEQSERSNLLGSIHLNGRPIYQQAGGGTASTLLVC